MGIRMGREKANGKIDFDILIDGKVEKRVTRGILIEDLGVGCNMSISGNEITLFNAVIGLQKEIEEQGLTERFESYREIIKADPKDKTEIMGMLDKMKSFIDGLK